MLISGYHICFVCCRFKCYGATNWDAMDLFIASTMHVSAPSLAHPSFEGEALRDDDFSPPQVTFMDGV